MSNPLVELRNLGQSVWLDNIRRGHILSGGLKKLIDEDGVSGETSNPTIFEKAIAESRVVVTFDLDFGEIVALCRGLKAGVIVFRLRNTRTPFVIQRLSDVIADCADALSKGAIVIVEESRHRIREFP